MSPAYPEDEAGVNYKELRSTFLYHCLFIIKIALKKSSWPLLVKVSKKVNSSLFTLIFLLTMEQQWKSRKG